MCTRLLILAGLTLLTVAQANAQKLINIDFGAHANPFLSLKTGKAASGLDSFALGTAQLTLIGRNAQSAELADVRGFRAGRLRSSAQVLSRNSGRLITAFAPKRVVKNEAFRSLILLKTLNP